MNIETDLHIYRVVILEKKMVEEYQEEFHAIASSDKSKEKGFQTTGESSCILLDKNKVS